MRSPAWVFWLYFCTFLPWLGCLVVYAWRRPWRNPNREVRRTARAVLTLYGALTAVLGYATCARFFRLPPHLLMVLAFVFIGGVCLAGFVQLTLVVRLIREGSKQ